MKVTDIWVVPLVWQMLTDVSGTLVFFIRVISDDGSSKQL
jgi:hypothetical protein